MTSTMTVTTPLPADQAEARVRETPPAQGSGILSGIDVRATLQEDA